MKIVLNMSVLGKNPTGLGVYSQHTCNRVSSYFNAKIIGGSKNENIKGEIIIQAPESISLGSKSTFATLRRLLWLSKIKFNTHQYLVYSPTHHGLTNQKNQIITIHDLICIHHKKQHRFQYLYFKYYLPYLIRKCRAIFTVSQTSKEEIANYYKFPLEKIFVIPNGVDRAVYTSVPNRKKENFLLMVGARYPHKNVEDVLRNSAYWKDQYTLIVASCSESYKRELEEIVISEKLGNQVIFKDYLSQTELINLYQTCSALVYPSKWEGFGIPPLEALACGANVIASDIPVHREVLGDAVTYIEIGKKESWKKAFEDLENNTIQNSKALEIERVLKKYSWDQAADKLKDVLISLEPTLELNIK